MVNVRDLKPGDLVMSLSGVKGMSVAPGDILRVVNVGYSKWDGWYYADCKNDKGWIIEIMKNYADFEKV